MSFLVLHMDKFKKEAVRGIQSHNERERESHSNPDIDYERSAENYELCDHATENYAEAIQNRIDDLLLVKAVRKDAVHMCGLIVSSDKEFFNNLSPEETRRFFEESKAFLTDFVGAENVISAMVHMDEKTPHMHFLHVPVTKDGRLNANKIYTRESLKKLQNEMPQYLQSRGFELQRGVEQEPGAAKRHLNTREFKQQQNALANLEQEAQAVSAELERKRREESDLQERLQDFERQAQEADKILAEQPTIPPASMFNFKPALERASSIIERQKKSLAVKHMVSEQNAKLKAEVKGLYERVDYWTAVSDQEKRRGNEAVSRLLKEQHNTLARLEEYEKFFRCTPEANKMHMDYLQEQRKEAERKAAEQKRLKQELEQKQQREREEKERREIELARQLEEQRQEKERERERQQAQSLERRPRGMGMGR